MNIDINSLASLIAYNVKIISEATGEPFYCVLAKVINILTLEYVDGAAERGF